METVHPVHDMLFRLSPWVLVPGSLVLFLLARTLIHSILARLAQHIVNGVQGILEFFTQPRT